MIRNKLKKIKHDMHGSTAIEYGLITALICVAILPLVLTLGARLNLTFFGAVNTAFTSVSNAS
jgi:Flp pilus assembly pilin Flp